MALLHGLIAIGELIAWRKPSLLVKLKFSDVEARHIAPVVANMGVYNGFLAAALLFARTIDGAREVELYLLSWAAVAGVFGALSLQRPLIALCQTLPAVIAAWFVYH